MKQRLINDTIIFQHVLSRSGCLEWVALTAPITLRYCLAHNMDYQLLVGDQPGRAGETGHWTIPRMIQVFLEMGYTNAIYLDADTIIVDETVDLREACAPDKIGAVWHNLSYLKPDWSHFNAGALYAKNTPRVRDFMVKWLAKYPGVKDFPWWEQGELNKLGVALDIINRLDNRWNAGHVSPSDKPVVMGLHGIPDRLEAMRKIVGGLHDPVR